MTIFTFDTIHFSPLFKNPGYTCSRSGNKVLIVGPHRVFTGQEVVIVYAQNNTSKIFQIIVRLFVRLCFKSMPELAKPPL